jgi:hypothetical protein
MLRVAAPLDFVSETKALWQRSADLRTIRIFFMRDDRVRPQSTTPEEKRR